MLSVVVVTYDEAERIAGCLESVLAACREVPAAEVILVDSNSTDGTVDVAAEYPITVLQIPSDDLTTPAAGRFVGTEAARGDYLLFVDGDVELAGGWLATALAIVRQRDDVAGVDGFLNEAGAERTEPVSMLHGVALYDAAVIADVAGFDPHLRALEDVELGYRLRAAGYRLLRLPEVVGHHPPHASAGELRRRWENGYYFGIGQVVRKSLGEPRLLAGFLARYRYQLAFQAWLLVGAASVLVGATGVAVWLVASLVLFAADAAWEGRERAVYRTCEYALLAVGFVRGLLLDRRDPAAFPLEVVRPVAGTRSSHGDATAPERRPAPSDAAGAEEADPAAHTEVEPT